MRAKAFYKERERGNKKGGRRKAIEPKSARRKEKGDADLDALALEDQSSAVG